jgi:hypothetical protein
MGFSQLLNFSTSYFLVFTEGAIPFMTGQAGSPGKTEEPMEDGGRQWEEDR